MEYTNKENINIVVELLKENDIRDLVISPGGTNIPVIKAVQNDPFFKCYSVVDERSAAYVAIGIWIQRRHPVALICTSAQATRNYIPGLTEAFYKRVPILAITMEKHPRFKYQEYMQAPDQTSLPRDCVKKSFELPFISDINDYQYSIRLVNEAIMELSRNNLGPIQLCIPWLDFPLGKAVPIVRSIKSYDVQEIQKTDLRGKKILLVIGEHIPFSEDEKKAINNFCEKTNSVVYVNHLSNFEGKYVLHANLFLLTANFDEIKNIKPDILISIGGQTGDYPFYLAFSNNLLEKMEHWRVCEDGKVVDTYDKLTKIYQGRMIDFFNAVKMECNDHSFYETWVECLGRKKISCCVPFSNVAIAQYLHDKIPNNSIIQFSILNSLRIWNLFNLDSSIECYSNVGAFGIDGGMSTLIGQSLVSDKLSFMIIGDLAFLYDMNCLSLRQLKNNVRILLINNNGGVEFKLNGESKEERDPYIAAADYHGCAKGWAESCGFTYLSARNMKEFIDCAEKFISYSECPIILEAFVSDYDESDAYLKVINDNKIPTKTDNAKQMIKSVIGEKNFNKIKHVLRG